MAKPNTHILPNGLLLNGKYRIEQVLGFGGFGITYKVEHIYLNEKKVIKEFFLAGKCVRNTDSQNIETQALSNEDFTKFKESFLAEARILSKLRNAPHTVPIVDFFEENNTAYIVLPFIDAIDLGVYLGQQAENRLSLTETLAIFQQIAAALQATHAANVIHRDIKPANVLIDKNKNAYLIDFGAAREYIAEGLTQTMTAVLTPGYAPLEQYSEKAKRGPTMDIYALGALLYRMLTGKTPPNAVDLASSAGKDLTPPHLLLPSIPILLSEAICKAMAIAPNDRFASIDEMKKAILSQPTPSAETLLLTKSVENHGAIAVVDTLGLSDPFAADMIYVSGGSFQMGRKTGWSWWIWSNDKPVHTVSVSSFYICKYLVTQAQWRAVMGSNPPALYNTNCDQCPVDRVSWDDIQLFLQKLNAQTGKKYRLPTEAEWEYAAKGGPNQEDYIYAGSNDIGSVAWYGGNYKSSKHGTQGTTHPVGQKRANSLGLYDMTGNVWEWCSDWYKGYPGSSGVSDYTGTCRVLRGGSWFNDSQNCRVAYRNNNAPSYRINSFGFRLVSSS